MEENTTAKFLPNPELKRLPVVMKCMGCNKIFENHTLPEGQILVDVCICYENPEVKWKNYRVEKGKKMKSGKEVEVLYHYSPCPMATHVKHFPKPIVNVRDRVKRK